MMSSFRTSEQSERRFGIQHNTGGKAALYLYWIPAFAGMTIILFSLPAYAGCDFFGECHDDVPVTEKAMSEIEIAPDMPPQPEPAKAINAAIHPDRKKPEQAKGSIGGKVSDPKMIKTGTIGGPLPDAVCVDKGDETECH